MLPLQGKVDLGVMTMKRYFAFPKFQYYWSLTIRLLCVISRTLFGGALPLCRDTVGELYGSSRLGQECIRYALGNRPALLKSGQWHFHEDNAPVHNSILVTYYLTKMRTLPIVQTLLPETFAYSLSSEAVVMRQLRR